MGLNGNAGIRKVNHNMGEWINAKTRLPKERGRYLVMLKTDGNIGYEVHDHFIKILYFGNGGWRFPRFFPEWIHNTLKQEVTHWMTLPDKPKDD